MQENMVQKNLSLQLIVGDSGSVRMNEFVAKILAPARLCKLIEANANIFYTTQNVWEILT